VKDVNLVLREKELDVVRVRKEIEALHLAIPLLAEDRDWVEHGMASSFPSPPSQGTGTTGSHGVLAFTKDRRQLPASS
jgi:hypothetical protein